MVYMYHINIYIYTPCMPYSPKTDDFFGVIKDNSRKLRTPTFLGGIYSNGTPSDRNSP